MTKLEYFFYTVLSNYITNKDDFIKLMCVNKKLRKLNGWYKQIRSPFIDEKLFPDNEGPKINNWDILYITIDNSIKTKLNYGENTKNIKIGYLHSLNDPLAVSSRFKELPKLIIPSNKILSDIFRFNFYDKLQEISLPTTMKCLRNKFQHCPILTKLVIPSSVTSIEGSIHFCDSLKELIIPKSVINIQRSIISNSNLSSLKILRNHVVIKDSIKFNHELVYLELNENNIFKLTGINQNILIDNHPDINIVNPN